MNNGIIEKSIIKAKKKSQLGQLPPSWFNRLPREELKVLAPQIFKDCADITIFLRETKDVTTASNLLTESLRKNKLINGNEYSKFEYIGEGRCGKAYKFNVKDEDFVLKVFHKLHDFDDLHGNRIEQNVAMYIKHNSKGNTNLVPVYFSDLRSGFIVSKFLDKNNPQKPEKILNLKKLGLNFLDFADKNLIGENIIDYGGMLPNIVAKNKAARSVYNRLLNSNDKIRFINTELANPNRTNERLAGIACGINTIKDRSDILKIAKILRMQKDPIINSTLIENHHYFPIETQKEMFKEFSQINNSELKKTLCNHIYILPKDERADWFAKNIDIKSKKSKVDFVSNLYQLPDEEQIKWFLLFAKDKSEYLQHTLKIISEDLDSQVLSRINNALK